MDLRDILFRSRGWIPVPFLLYGLWFAQFNPLLIVVGALMALIGELLRIVAIRHAGGATRTRDVGAHELVSSGPYGHVRNPLYLANMLLYTGFALGSGASSPYLPIVVWLWFAFQYGMIISLEESTLKGMFGPTYLDYCKRVPRLWPRLRFAGVARSAPVSLAASLREERSTILGLMVSWILLTLRLVVWTPVK